MTTKAETLTSSIIDRLKDNQQDRAIREFSPQMRVHKERTGMRGEERQFLETRYLHKNSLAALELTEISSQHCINATIILSPENLLRNLGKRACLRAYEIDELEGLHGINITDKLMAEGLMTNDQIKDLMSEAGKIEEIVTEAIANAGRWYVGLMLIG